MAILAILSAQKRSNGSQEPSQAPVYRGLVRGYGPGLARRLPELPNGHIGHMGSEGLGASVKPQGIGAWEGSPEPF